MKNLATEIVKWIGNYAAENNIKSLVVGVSGGVDSALVSTLCAMTGLPTHCVILPCQTKSGETKRGYNHINWLRGKFDNINTHTIDLTKTFDQFLQETNVHYSNELAYSNAKSRLRMIALYHVATCNGGIVVGTGNKVEDGGIGFCTKYGDSGVDISPIGDLMKTEVRQMCRELGVLPELSEAIPTDGLWDDGRSDEDAIGATYKELEWAMDYIEKHPNWKEKMVARLPRDEEVLKIYTKRHAATMHKLLPIPTFKRNANNSTT
jgi:NAD+ synthase